MELLILLLPHLTTSGRVNDYSVIATFSHCFISIISIYHLIYAMRVCMLSRFSCVQLFVIP